MAGIAGLAVPDNLGVDLRAASEGMFPLLEHEHGSTLGHHESVAGRVERT